MSLGVADVTRIPDLLSSRAARPIRFGAVGIVTFGVQAGAFFLIKYAGLPAFLANAFALAIAVQFNFAANQLFVWGDMPVALFSRAFARRWTAYHGCVGLSLVINYGVFLVSLFFIPAFFALLMGVASSTAIKFISLDRFAFTPSRGG